MKVLMITGDRKMKAGHPRFDLQRAQVKDLVSVFWGRGALFAPFRTAGAFDVVTVQDPFWRGLVAWFVARRKGAKFNVQVHTDLSVQNTIRHVLAQVVLRRADSVRVVSEKIKQQVVAMGVRAHVTVLPVFVDVERFRTIERKPHETKKILWLGRFEEEKDPALAIEVLRDVRAKGIDATLVMLGTGSLRGTLLSLATGLPVEFPGWQDPLIYLAQADVVVCTSKHESYGASIIEALAAGVPVVAPDVGAAKEAGAVVVPRSKIAEKTAEILQKGGEGKLNLQTYSPDAWAVAWKKTLEI